MLARVTLDPPPGQRVFAVEGPESISGPQAAQIWSEALGRPVRYLGPKNDRWRATLARTLAGQKRVDYEKTLATPLPMTIAVSQARLAGTVTLLGRAPRTYREYATERAAQLRT